MGFFFFLYTILVLYLVWYYVAIILWCFYILLCLNSMDFRELRFARAMEFTIHEINNRTDLLPGITLGYQIHDSCSTVPMAIKVAFQLANGFESVFNNTNSCSKSAVSAVTAVIGDSASTPSISIARVLGLFRIPQVKILAHIYCVFIFVVVYAVLCMQALTHGNVHYYH